MNAMTTITLTSKKTFIDNDDEFCVPIPTIFLTWSVKHGCPVSIVSSKSSIKRVDQM